MIIETFKAVDDFGTTYFVSVDQVIRTNGTGANMSEIRGRKYYFDQFGHTVQPVNPPDLWEIKETGIRIRRSNSGEE